MTRIAAATAGRIYRSESARLVGAAALVAGCATVIIARDWLSPFASLLGL